MNLHLNWALGVWTSDLCNRPAEASSRLARGSALPQVKEMSDGAELQRQALVARMRVFQRVLVLASVVAVAVAAGAGVRPL